MKRILRIITVSSIVLAAVVGIFGFSKANAAEANGNGIKVSPVRSDLTINPGESKTVTMTVQNVTGSEATFQAIINDFVANSENGEPALILDSSKYAPSHSLKRYIGNISNFSLKAGETKNISVNISIPSSAAGGGYYGAVRFAPASTDGGKNVTLSASVGSIILVRVPGDIKDDMTISSFDVRRGKDGVSGSSFFVTNKDLYSVVRFHNSGNVHEQPFGKVQLLKGSKVIQETEINTATPKGNVLPDSTRRFDVKLDKVGAFGKYTVQGNFGYGSNGQLLSATTSFWVIPLPLIVTVIGVIIVLLALIFGLPKAIKRYNRNVLRKAGRR